MSISDEEWTPLRAELDRWVEAGLTPTLWWRDDDAIAPTAALDRMLALSQDFGVPLGLAVIPARATEALARRLEQVVLVDVLQHGFDHTNHAHAGERAAEFGAQRPLAVRLEAIDDGWQRLAGWPRRTPIFVPPWNRYDTDLAASLGLRGFRAISAFAAAKRLPGGIVECNCHVDIISWRTTRGFAGTVKTMGKLVEHLQARRTGVAAMSHATGLLTHHLAHDEACWQFLAALLARIATVPEVRFLRPLQAATAMEAT